MDMDISRQDWQLLSAYVDDELSEKEKARLEERLDADRNLQAAYRRLQETRRLLQSAPKLSAPRNFTLTPDMVGQGEGRTFFPAFRLATALATFLLVAVLVLDFSGAVLPGGSMAPAAPAMRQEAAEFEGEGMEGATRQPERDEPQVESLAEKAQETEGEKAAGDMETERPAEEGVTVSKAVESTQTPPWTATNLPPSPTGISTPSPVPERGGGGISPLRMAELVLGGLILILAMGMFLTRKGDQDVG